MRASLLLRRLRHCWFRRSSASSLSHLHTPTRPSSCFPPSPPTSTHADPAARRQRHAALMHPPAPAHGSGTTLDVIPLTSTPMHAAGTTQPSTDEQQGPACSPEAPPPELWGQSEQLMSGCEQGSAPLRVAVLLSGGVDSSLALRLLLAAGHQCTAFYLQIWFQEDFRNFWDACPWEEDLGYAQKVCDALGVELRVVPMTQQYWERVVAHSVREIREGRTPNPDMLCNSCVKFGAFYDYLDQEHSGRFDRIASGHYARVVRSSTSGTSSTSDTSRTSGTNSSLGLADVGVAGGPRGCSSVGKGQQSNGDSSSSHDRALAGSHASSSDGGGSSGGGGSNGSDWLLRQQAQRASPDAPERQAGPGPGSSRSSGSGSGSTGSQAKAAATGGGDWVARLALTPDPVKDQTYFLAHLSPRQLARAMFPLGTLTKKEVRQLAAAAKLANMDRKDSQGICFLGKVKFAEFVKEHLGEWPGLLVEAETGAVLGMHLGYWFYTVGQRSGIKLAGGPWYVVRKDRDLNIVYASKHYYAQDKARNAFVTGPVNWVSDLRPDPARDVYCKVRHGPAQYRCSTFELLPTAVAADLAASDRASLKCSQSQLQPQAQGQQPHGQGQQPQAPSSSNVAAPTSESCDDGLRAAGCEAGQVGGRGRAGTQVAVVEAAGDEGVAARVVLDGNDQGLAAGQYAVFYQDGLCLGAAKLL